MKTLRTLHLYLGCIFAPMILFFAISGLWQTFSLQWPKHGPTILTYLSTIHTGRGLKTAGISTLSSPLMEIFVVVTTISFIATIILGLAMAFKFGRKRAATVCLVAGIVIPVVLVGLALRR